MRARVAAAAVMAAMSLAGCSMGSVLPEPSTADDASGDAASLPPRAFTAGTCWSADTLGADPQRALRLSADLGVGYFDTAYAIADRPAFVKPRPCAGAHAI